ncbi:MAG: hypothetical protein KBD01_04585 [Acidobacteria bacterium]|nr:hypothetical protein [Acidobacteriota bacterium]
MTPRRASSSPRALAALLALAAGLSAGCASLPRQDVAAGPGACREGSYRGRYAGAAAGAEARHFRAQVRVCGESLVMEARGAVGGAGLVAAVRDGRALLLFPRERKAVEGPDTAAFWEKWTGAPLTGELLLVALSAAGEAPRQAGAWRFETTGDTGRLGFPEHVRGRAESGDTLELARTGERAAAGGQRWPVVPASFERVAE